MAYGTQLRQLVSRVRGEVMRSTSVSVGVDTLDALKDHIRSVQQELYDDYDWPHLRVMPYKVLAAGQRYYDAPTEINLDRVEEVQAWWSGTPKPIRHGIGFDEYAQYDSDSDERADPVRAWDTRRTSTTATQIEVWPIPVSNDQKLQFRGLRPLRAMVEDDDTADLDDTLIVLFTAADIAAAQKSENASRLLERAIRHMGKRKSRAAGGNDIPIMGGGYDPGRRGYGTIIRVG